MTSHDHSPHFFMLPVIPSSLNPNDKVPCLPPLCWRPREQSMARDWVFHSRDASHPVIVGWSRRGRLLWWVVFCHKNGRKYVKNIANGKMPAKKLMILKTCPSTRISCSGVDLDSETKPRCCFRKCIYNPKLDLGRHPRDISFGCVPVPTKQGKVAYYLTIALSHNAYVYLNISIYMYMYREREGRERERYSYIVCTRYIFFDTSYICNQHTLPAWPVCFLWWCQGQTFNTVEWVSSLKKLRYLLNTPLNTI